MSFCPFCGENIKDGGKCTGCGYTPDNSTKGAFNSSFGTENINYEIPTWLKIVIVVAMFLVGGGTIIGLIAGAVLSTSKDPKYKTYGKWLFKAALITIAVKVVISVIAFILFMVVGVGGAIFMTSPEITGVVTCIA